MKEITNVQNLTEIGYTNKDGADRKTSSEGPEGEGEESNNNEEESKPTVLVQIENTKEGDSNRLDGGRGGRKVVTGSKRTTSHIVWESDYVITSEWRIETDSKKPKLNGQANEKAEIATEGQNCIPKRTKKVSKLAKAKKEAKQAKKELSESTLDTDLENYFIESKKKKSEENKMEVEESVSEDAKENGTTSPSDDQNTESIATETEKMETDEPEKEQPVESNDDKEQWSDKWSDGKKENDDPMTEEEEQTLLDEDISKTDDDKAEETQDSKISDLPGEKEQGETPREPSAEKNDSAEPTHDEPPKDIEESVPEETSDEKQENVSEEPAAETSADSLPPLEDADASTDQSNDPTENDVIPWQRIVKVSIPEEAIGKTLIRQQDLINKIGKKNYGGKVYYEKGQTEAYLLVAESARETVAAMKENPGTE